MWKHVFAEAIVAAEVAWAEVRRRRLASFTLCFLVLRFLVLRLLLGPLHCLGILVIMAGYVGVNINPSIPMDHSRSGSSIVDSVVESSFSVLLSTLPEIPACSTARLSSVFALHR